ncbi:MAG: transcriptional coactivator/pterin dehydratase [Acidimicrobiales bacterium]|jgi:4a-hydroxytetrahydrobiopterin dehydratase|nr:transcriptional coactivator/pterin dehydratase [Acidimicrobiales bacterium]
MVVRLTDDEVAGGLDRLPGWTRDGDAIAKEFAMADFPAAIAFVVHVAFAAEKANHHPDIDIRWNRVRLALTTHDAGGLTARDLSLAEAIAGMASGSIG